MSKPRANADFDIPTFGSPPDGAVTKEHRAKETAAEFTKRIRSERDAGSRARALDGMTQKLRVYGEVPGFHLHIFKDDKNRINEALQHGWVKVDADEIEGVGANVTSYNTDPGGCIRFVLGTHENGEPMYGYLMKYPLELWNEDMAAADLRNQAVDAAIRRGKPPGQTDAEMEQTYVAKSGISFDPRNSTISR